MGNFLETGVPSELQFFCSRCGDVQVITVKDADHFKTVLDKAVAKKLLKDYEKQIKALRGAIQTVLDDAESQKGGWGPDVTMVEVLKQALATKE